MRELLVAALLVTTFGCASSQQVHSSNRTDSSTAKYGVQSTTGNTVRVKEIVANPEFNEASAKKVAEDILKKSNIKSISSRKSKILDVQKEFNLDSLPYTSESEVWITTSNGEMIWPFVDEAALLSDQDRARVKSKGIVMVISPETGRLITAFQTK